mmetsp:Transcript_107862/g.302036  ORF Transcript_107862/g.302036 Transcript_107862/m.302036 type:complete len:250 (+) Transcript_107862:321-1070(+)
MTTLPSPMVSLISSWVMSRNPSDNDSKAGRFARNRQPPSLRSQAPLAEICPTALNASKTSEPERPPSMELATSFAACAWRCMPKISSARPRFRSAARSMQEAKLSAPFFRAPPSAATMRSVSAARALAPSSTGSGADSGARFKSSWIWPMTSFASTDCSDSDSMGHDRPSLSRSPRRCLITSWCIGCFSSRARWAEEFFSVSYGIWSRACGCNSKENNESMTSAESLMASALEISRTSAGTYPFRAANL